MYLFAIDIESIKTMENFLDCFRPYVKARFWPSVYRNHSRLPKMHLFSTHCPKLEKGGNKESVLKSLKANLGFIEARGHLGHL